MAMKICKECGKPISDSAKVCPHCGKEYRYDGIGYLMVSLVFFALIIGGMVRTTDSLKSSISTNYNSTSTRTNVNNNKITLQKFNEIKMGMTYKEVVAIIGEEGTVVSEVDLDIDSRYKTTMYHWYASDGMANANVTIQGGKVVSKAQFGLK